MGALPSREGLLLSKGPGGWRVKAYLWTGSGTEGNTIRDRGGPKKVGGIEGGSVMGGGGMGKRVWWPGGGIQPGGGMGMAPLGRRVGTGGKEGMGKGKGGTGGWLHPDVMAGGGLELLGCVLQLMEGRDTS